MPGTKSAFNLVLVAISVCFSTIARSLCSSARSSEGFCSEIVSATSSFFTSTANSKDGKNNTTKESEYNNHVFFFNICFRFPFSLSISTKPLPLPHGEKAFYAGGGNITFVPNFPKLFSAIASVLDSYHHEPFPATHKRFGPNQQGLGLAASFELQQRAHSPQHVGAKRRSRPSGAAGLASESKN